MAEINKTYIEYAEGKHQSLEEISEKDVIEFLKRDRPFGRPYLGQIPKAKCAHIGEMFKDLCDSGYIKENRMSRLLKRATVVFASEANSNDIAEKVLSLQEMKVIFSEDTVNALFDEDIKIMDKNNERINTLHHRRCVRLLFIICINADVDIILIKKFLVYN